jgi:hypothetical protein
MSLARPSKVNPEGATHMKNPIVMMNIDLRWG